MNIEKYADVLVGESRTPCFITDMKTSNIVYKNHSMDMLLANTSVKNIIGEKCYNVITSNQAEENRVSTLLNSAFVYEKVIYDDNLKTHLNSTFCKINFQEKDYILCKYAPVGDEKSKKIPYEEAITKCMFILDQEADTISVSLMQLLCDFYHSDGAFVYTITKTSIECTSKWCNEHSENIDKSILDLSKNLNTKSFSKWLGNCNEMGIIDVNQRHDNHQHDDISKEILSVFGVENVLISVVSDEQNDTIRVLGIVDRKSDFFDFRLLNAVTLFVNQNENKSQIEVTLDEVRRKDQLTDFYSHIAYSKKIEEIKNAPYKSIGVIVVNINGLKKINEGFGYVQGDMHIKSVASKIRKHFGYVFYRISGDEFIGIAPNIQKEKFNKHVNDLYIEMKKSDNQDFAFGQAFAEGNYNFPKLVTDAGVIMYVNKQEYYASKTDNLDEIRDDTLMNLLKYLANDEFMVYLQPQVCLTTGKLVGAEALIRRFDKTNQKMVFPDQFIPLYENKSIIRHVDFFVIETVCKLLKQWEIEEKAIPISVNLSRVTLQEHGIADSITEICEKYGIDHKNLVIEVTERVGLVENDVESSLITGLRKNGFSISLDDFGCAYSNIVTLAQIDVDEVKIDKSLVDDLLINEKTHIIVGNMLNMCNSFRNTHTLAEGIEEEIQVEMLVEYGCNYGQGYFYSRPIPIDEFYDKYINN
ncbi:MAG: GGDEF domain-containing phosphodiesterase [Clostridia bacterium]